MAIYEGFSYVCNTSGMYNIRPFKTTVAVTHEPRARDPGAKGPREYWWEAPNRGSTGERHRAEPREYRSASLSYYDHRQ